MTNSYRLVLFLLLLQAVSSGSAKSPYEMVDQYIGTGGGGWGEGELPVGAQVPFGMVRLGPDTVTYRGTPIPWSHNGGYHYDDNLIRGFSHQHLLGAGARDLGTVRVMPMMDKPEPTDPIGLNYAVEFSHRNEILNPGYYSINLNNNIQAELTASAFAGFHRYTFPDESPSPTILFPLTDLLEPLSCKGMNFTVDQSRGQINGWIIQHGALSGRISSTGYKVWFSISFDSPIASFGTYKGANQFSAPTVSGEFETGGWVSFDKKTVEMYVGISSISIHQASANAQTILKSAPNFAAVRKNTFALWNEALAPFSIAGGSLSDQTKFWSFLYRTLSSPTQMDEESGIYRGFDYMDHDLPSTMKHYYSGMSIWDTHRTLTPWLALVQPQVALDSINSLLLMVEQGGTLPRWPFLYGYTGSMIAQHAVIVIIDAFVKGITQFDHEAAYEAMKTVCTQDVKMGRPLIKYWEANGLIPADFNSKSAPLTLAYSYDDFVLSTFAAKLGKEADAKMFLERSGNFKNVWEPQEKFFCPRFLNGTFHCPAYYDFIDPFSDSYVEGDAWHYRFNVQHNVPALIELFGSNLTFVKELEKFQERSKLDPSTFLPNPYFWAGNEEDLMTPYLFNHAGRADLTQEFVRYNMDYRWTTEPDGIPGNDDYATMSAWWLWGSLGLYPISGTTTYFIGSPVFTNFTLVRPEGNLSIIAHGASPTNIYVQSVKANGRVVPQDNMFINHSELMGEAVIEFVMSSSKFV